MLKLAHFSVRAFKKEGLRQIAIGFAKRHEILAKVCLEECDSRSVRYALPEAT